MSEIKLVASDLDGTLLNTAGAVSAENLSAIHELAVRGVLFVPASGRAYNELMSELSENPDIRYYILSSGADIYDKNTDTLSSISISRKSLVKILDTVSKYASFTVAHCGKSCIADMQSLEETTLISGYIKELFRECSDDVGNIMEELYLHDDISLLSIAFESNAVIDEVLDELSVLDDIAVSKNTLGRGTYNIELSAKGADKGSAAVRLAKMLEIPEENVAVVGDSGNDYPMISKFKNSFAVANAREIIKNSANYVLCSNDEHSIKYFLNHVVIKDEREKLVNER